MKRLMLGVKAQGFGLQRGWGLNFWGSRAVVFTCVLGLREPMASVFAEARARQTRWRGAYNTQAGPPATRTNQCLT